MVCILVLLSDFFLNETSTYAWDMTGNIDLIYGSKDLSEDWKPVVGHNAYGGEIDFKYEGMPFSIYLGYMESSGSGVYIEHRHGGNITYNEEIATEEYHVGIRKTWNIPFSLHPYINGGISFIKMNGILHETSPHDLYVKGKGIWFGGGLYHTIFKQLNIGVDVKVSNDIKDSYPTNNKKEGEVISLGGGYAMFVFGYHF
ncbi:hypothetical protein ACFL6P_00635 [Candidatus Latescibacterota bacterium]